MEHTANIMKTNKGLISSLLKISSMFELRLLSDKEKMDIISKPCINCKIETCLFFENTTFG